MQATTVLCWSPTPDQQPPNQSYCSCGPASTLWPEWPLLRHKSDHSSGLLPALHGCQLHLEEGSAPHLSLPGPAWGARTFLTSLPHLHASTCCTSSSPRCCPPGGLCTYRSPSKLSRPGACALFLPSLLGQAFPEQPPEGRTSSRSPGALHHIPPSPLCCHPGRYENSEWSCPLCACHFCVLLKTSAPPGQGVLSVSVTPVSLGPRTAPGTQEVLQKAWVLEELTRECSYSSLLYI